MSRSSLRYRTQTRASRFIASLFFSDEQDEIELKPRESTVVQVFEAHGLTENDIDQGDVHCTSEDQTQSYYFGFDGESVIGDGKSNVHGLDCSVAGIFKLMNI
ncbi:hypothetical protein ACA910_020837 [Epithemia clementina (nom. ined.)]